MKKLVTLFSLFLLISVWGHAEIMYVTVVDSDASASPQKSDIALKIDKKDAAVTEFAVVDTAARSAEMLSHPAGRRQYFLLYDLLHSQPEDIVTARKTTETFLAKLGKDDLVAIASLGQKTGFRILSGLTTDRNKINTGLNLLGIEKIEGMVQGPDGN